MNILFLLIIISILISLLFLLIFIICINNGDFDDIKSPSIRILKD